MGAYSKLNLAALAGLPRNFAELPPTWEALKMPPAPQNPALTSLAARDHQQNDAKRNHRLGEKTLEGQLSPSGGKES